MRTMQGKVRKLYATPVLTRLGDVEKITQLHEATAPNDCPFGSVNDIKSAIGQCDG
jgi:hypothetical protein